MDDLIIISEGFEIHLRRIEFVLTRLIEAGLKINREKCEFGYSRVIYLGYGLGQEGLRPDSERIKPVLEMPSPKNVAELRRVLGMFGWYSRFIANELI